MRKIGLFIGVFIAVGLSACSGPTGITNSPDEMVFTEDEVDSINNADDGFEFTEDEVDAINDVQEQKDPESDVIDLGEEVIPSEDTIDIPLLVDWTVTYETLTTVCPEGTLTFSPPDPEIVTISIAEDHNIIYFDNLTTGQRLEFKLFEKGPGGANYTSSITIDGVTLNYDVFFFRYDTQGRYDWMEGSIKSENEGCSLDRPFYGRPVE